MDETDRIMKAQSARGADFVTGSIIQRAKNMVPLLVLYSLVPLDVLMNWLLLWKRVAIEVV